MAFVLQDPGSARGDALVLRLPDHTEGLVLGLSLARGWWATLLFHGFETVWLVELASEAGEQGTLFITPGCELITHEAERLPDACLINIAEATARWRAEPDHPATQEALAGFGQLNRATRARIPLSGFLPEIEFQPLEAAAATTTLRRPDGTTTAVRHASGEPVAAPATRARLLLALFSPLCIVDFEMAAEPQPAWFLHQDGTLFGGSLDSVPPALLALVTERGDRLMRQIASGDGRFDPLRLINSRTRDALMALFPRSDQGSRLDGLQGRLAYAAAGQPFTLTETLAPVEDAGLFGERSAGWFTDAEGGGWIVGTSSHLDFAVPEPAEAFRLRLDIASVRDGVRMTVLAAGWAIGSHRLTASQSQGTSLTWFIPPEQVGAGRLRIGFLFEPPLAGADAAFRLDRAALFTGRRRPGVEPPPDRELLGGFSSLGANCELGFVQRHFGLEPMGLFRFAGCHGLLRQIHLIETGFAGLGAPGSLRCSVNTFRGEDEYMVWADQAGLFYHTWRSPGEIGVNEMLAENETKLAYLGRKLVEEMEDGDKIFVYKANPSCSLGEMLSLHAALNRHGRNRLFWITQLERGQQPGEVEWAAPNLLKGYTGGTDIPEQPDIGTWLTLCRNAYAAFGAAAQPQRLSRPQAPPAHQQLPAHRTPLPEASEPVMLAEPVAPAARVPWPPVPSEILSDPVPEEPPSGAFARLRARLLSRGSPDGRH